MDMGVRVEIIETLSLGDRSYVVADEDAVVVIDPQRDIDRVIQLIGEGAARITHVMETHLHNHYVTGGLELSRSTGADYVVPRGDDVGYPARRVGDGDVIDAGGFRFRVIHNTGAHARARQLCTHRCRGAITGRIYRWLNAFRHNRTHRPARPRAHPHAHCRSVPLGAPVGRRTPSRDAGIPHSRFRKFLCGGRAGKKLLDGG